MCRLQTLPDGLEFDCGRTDVQKMLGHAVPSLLAEVLAWEIRRQFLGDPTRPEEFKLMPPHAAVFRRWCPLSGRRDLGAGDPAGSQTARCVSPAGAVPSGALPRLKAEPVRVAAVQRRTTALLGNVLRVVFVARGAGNGAQPRPSASEITRRRDSTEWIADRARRRHTRRCIRYIESCRTAAYPARPSLPGSNIVGGHLGGVAD